MYTIVIDESGDIGLDQVQPDPGPGPTQYFTMAAVIFNEENRASIEEAASNFPWNSKKASHAKHLSHFQKVHMCKEICKLRVGLFGVISNKLTLGEYLPEAQRTPTHFYNKVTQYLLEKLGAGVASVGIPREELRIHLEARDQKYSSLISYIESIQNTPLDERSIPIRNIDRFSIAAVKKADEPCVWVADMAAHALFCAVRKDAKTFGHTETRYLRELAPSFFAKKNGRVLGGGLKAIHSLTDLGCDPSTSAELSRLQNQNRRFHKL